MADREQEIYVQQLKKARSSAKSKLTRKMSIIKGLMNNPENLTAVKDLLDEAQDAVRVFNNAHEAYHKELKSVGERQESNEYRTYVETAIKEFEHEIDLWLKQISIDIERSSARQPANLDVSVQAEDSISNVGSETSYHTRSSCNSYARSTTSDSTRAAARKAVLEAEAETLKQLQELEIKELLLQHQKRKLELRCEIAAAEAEHSVYEKAEVGELDQLRPPTSIAQSGRSKNPTEKPQSVADERESITYDQRLNSTPSSFRNQRNSSHDESIRRIVEMQDQQSSALQLLIQQQQQGVMALTLPQPSMQVFSGDPVDYCDFIRAFEHLIESKTTSPNARLYYLIQHTTGPVQELMKSCLSMREDEGYAEARKLLKERYGQNYRIAAAHVQRLIDGPPIKNEDATALQRFSVQLTSCTNTLEKIGYLSKLDNSENLKKLIDRLPYAMRAKWRETVDHIIRREARDVTIKDINEFVAARARATTHPIFGNIALEKPKLPIPSSKSRQHGKGAGFSTQSEATTLKCPKCDSNHWLSRCDKFKKQSLEDRQKFVREKKLCNNCLSTGHFVRSCPKKSFCKVEGCTSKHSTFLHPKQNQPPPNNKSNSKDENESAKSPEPVSDQGNAANNSYVESKSSMQNSSVTGLAIVPVYVNVKGESRTVKTYAFLDSGSNTTFCTDALLRKLGTNGTMAELSLTTMEQENTPVKCSRISLEISDYERKCNIELATVYSRPNLPVPKEAISKQEDVNRWPYLNGVKVSSIESDIGLLVGSDVPQALQPFEVRESKNGGPFAIRTALGWVLNGPLGRSQEKILTTNFIEANQTLEQQFRSYCDLEFNDSKYDAKPTMSQNDRKALGIMEESATMRNGHYEIALPWRNYPPDLQNNKPQAERRLQLLKKRLLKEPRLLEKYREFMDNLFLKDYARKIPQQRREPLGIQWYLPHHPVFHPQKPDKVRVVFDCSAKHGNSSLNDQLLQGPDLTNSLVDVLTRFREEPIAFMSDIEAMFHQVRVRSSDRDALRFLWWPDGDLNSSPEEYQMNVHLFGSASSPSCANFALKKTASDNAQLFSDQTVKTVQRNFYVDDCLKSVGQEDEAVKLAKELVDLLALGGFKLTKWLSNSKKVMEALPESERAPQVKDLDFDKIPVERALGVRWNVSSDTFGFAIVIKDRPATRRGILSTVSSVYDPLGFVAPFILSAKLILQDLCRLKLDWDDKIPNEFLDRWQAWLSDLPQLETLAIERCFKPPTIKEIASTQLHHFSDASQQGYGAVSYLRVADVQGNVNCSFVMGKSRLAPIKPISILRLELSAAVVATKLEKMTRNELSLPVDQSFFWTDSTCVLRYIENTDKRFQTFVANRIATIHDASSPSQWNYVDTHSNPADDASRGVRSNSLQRWIKGPDFLSKPRKDWPKKPEGFINITTEDDDPEVKKSSLVYVTDVSNANDKPLVVEVVERFSSWCRAKRVFAWILRYQRNLRLLAQSRKLDQTDPRNSCQVPPISITELVNAETEILKHIQQSNFKEELSRLQRNEANSINKTSCIAKLDPVLIDGLIRVGGRLHRAQIDDDARHPIILPKNHHVVDLIIQYYHCISGHSGLEHTLSLIRQKFWVIKARPAVKRVLNGCISCRKRQAPVAEQKMASLPADRITPEKPPFTYTGVDCFGPFEVRRGRTKAKRYGVIFTCLTVRAIHIEVASSLDTASFVNALRRFIARRGQPEEIRSDNGGNFVKGEKELRQEIDNWNQEQINDFLVQRKIKWTFNPPAGSHHGGVWERCIRTVRKVMKAMMKEQVLDDEGLNTLMCEVEAIVNGRPLTKLSDDPRDLEPLTPNHLLLLRSGSKVPPGVFTKEDCYGNRRWRQVQYFAGVFWRRWIKEYLPSLQERQKWTKEQRNLAVGDVVLVLDEKTPRCSWPLGRVQEVYTNRKDGLVRSVKVKTKGSLLVRPVDKIVFLESEATPGKDK